jgi:polyhydroxyalkanoate synthesis repressor PhaR
MAYVVKRYSNRKLYDQQASRYITLDEIRQLIRGGTEVRVEDAVTGEDLTSLTLTQILLESERAEHAVPSALLHQLIKHGEAWFSFLDRAMRSASLDQLSGTPRDIARFWTDWAARAGWHQPSPATAEPAAAAAPTVEDEITSLKEKLLSLEKRVEKKKRASRRRPARPSLRRRR